MRIWFYTPGQYRKMPKRLREAERRGLAVYTIRSNTYVQVRRFLKNSWASAEKAKPWQKQKRKPGWL